MSAFVVDKAHINAMVRAGLAVQCKPLHWYTKDEDSKTGMESHTLTDDNADEVGQMLLDECVRSVCYRYEDSERTNLPGRNDAEYIMPFKFKPSYQPLPLVQMLKLISCYMYQTCEHPEWKDSEAYAFCHALRNAMIDQLPGYEEAEWEWTKWPEENLHRIC